MITAYVLMNCALGKEQTVLDYLCKIQDIVEARATYGVNDIFVRIKTLNKDTLAAVMEMVRRTPHLTHTSTLQAIDEYGGKSEGKLYCSKCNSQMRVEPE